MKIEKISDTQIRCTLSRSDLAERELKISELAYGTEKAKDFFHEMIEQAASDFGFEADEAPLMIEAIPISGDSIVLVITKVEDSDEIESRFSKFGEALGTSTQAVDEPSSGYSSLDFDDNFIPMSETLESAGKETSEDTSEDIEEIIRIYSFESWDKAKAAIADVGHDFSDESMFLKDSSGTYHLILKTRTSDKQNFMMACNLISEYGRTCPGNYATCQYLMEHCQTIIKSNALKILAEF